jgi:hypothetical protein
VTTPNPYVMCVSCEYFKKIGGQRTFLGDPKGVCINPSGVKYSELNEKPRSRIKCEAFKSKPSSREKPSRKGDSPSRTEEVVAPMTFQGKV